MDALKKLALQMAIGVIQMALPLITDGLRALMIDSVQKWDAYSRQTPKNWDNVIVDALQALLKIPDAEPCPEPGPDPSGIPMAVPKLGV
jgi:hypothetical protein